MLMRRGDDHFVLVAAAQLYNNASLCLDLARSPPAAFGQESQRCDKKCTKKEDSCPRPISTSN